MLKIVRSNDSLKSRALKSLAPGRGRLSGRDGGVSESQSDAAAPPALGSSLLSTAAVSSPLPPLCLFCSLLPSYSHCCCCCCCCCCGSDQPSDCCISLQTSRPSHLSCPAAADPGSGLLQGESASRPVSGTVSVWSPSVRSRPWAGASRPTSCATVANRGRPAVSGSSGASPPESSIRAARTAYCRPGSTESWGIQTQTSERPAVAGPAAQSPGVYRHRYQSGQHGVLQARQHRVLGYTDTDIRAASTAYCGPGSTESWGIQTQTSERPARRTAGPAAQSPGVYRQTSERPAQRTAGPAEQSPGVYRHRHQSGQHGVLQARQNRVLGYTDTDIRAASTAYCRPGQHRVLGYTDTDIRAASTAYCRPGSTESWGIQTQTSERPAVAGPAAQSPGVYRQTSERPARRTAGPAVQSPGVYRHRHQSGQHSVLQARQYRVLGYTDTDIRAASTAYCRPGRTESWGTQTDIRAASTAYCRPGSTESWGIQTQTSERPAQRTAGPAVQSPGVYRQTSERPARRTAGPAVQSPGVYRHRHQSGQHGVLRARQYRVLGYTDTDVRAASTAYCGPGSTESWGIQTQTSERPARRTAGPAEQSPGVYRHRHQSGQHGVLRARQYRVLGYTDTDIRAASTAYCRPGSTEYWGRRGRSIG